MLPYYIFVTGGVMSGLGKGITTASLGKVLQSKGYDVTIMKLDPYLNVDAGTMNPIIHGEVFVTQDGGETDEDLGHYERFLNRPLSMSHNVTTGQVYLEVIQGERRGDYLGRCVEAFPHITDEIKKRIRTVCQKEKPDFLLVEIGGTVGEYQNEIFFRAAREMRREGDKILFIHTVYLPVPPSLGEMKTKPAQQSVELLGGLAIQPDFIVCRS